MALVISEEFTVHCMNKNDRIYEEIKIEVSAVLLLKSQRNFEAEMR